MDESQVDTGETMPGPVSNVKKPKSVKRTTPRKRNGVRKPNQNTPKRRVVAGSSTGSKASMKPIPAALTNDPVQEIYDHCKAVCAALKPLVKP